MYQRIVVPLDGSDLAEVALPHALHMARLSHAPLHLVRVVDTTVEGRYDAYGMAAGYMSIADVFDLDRQAAADYMEVMRHKLSDDGQSVTFELRVGQVAREIVAALQPDDLVVMTSHGRGGIARWFMGSVAEDVTRHATVPVLLIRLTQAEVQQQLRVLETVGQPAD